MCVFSARLSLGLVGLAPFGVPRFRALGVLLPRPVSRGFVLGGGASTSIALVCEVFFACVRNP